jgi:hypothetical protein
MRTGKPSRFTRLQVRARRHQLDAKLAAGADPNNDELLNWRAHELTSADMRKRVADSFDEAMGRIPMSNRQAPTAVFMDSDAVRVALRELRELVDRLNGPDPVSPQGVARAQRLLTEGASPIYAPGNGPELQMLVRQSIRGLDSGPELII